MVNKHPKWGNTFEDWKVEFSEELSSSYLIDKDTFHGHESMFERTIAWGKRVENVMLGTHVSTLMTFYPDMEWCCPADPRKMFSSTLWNRELDFLKQKTVR